MPSDKSPGQRSENNQGAAFYPDTQYKRESETVPFQGKEITLDNLTPILTPQQEQQARKELEQRLYDVFFKYVQTRREKERSDSE